MQTQELIALALVASVVAVALFRWQRNRKQSGCGSCSANKNNKQSAANQSGGSNTESVVRFHRKA